MWNGLCIHAIMTAFAIVRPGLIDAFETEEFVFSGGKYDNHVFTYQLYVPKAEKEEHLPLLVWLHGAGEKGSDNVVHLRWLDRVISEDNGVQEKHFYVLAMQCPEENPFWYLSSVQRSDDMCEVLHVAIGNVSRNHSIDKNKIYLSGVSSGGAAVWEFGMRYPELFAALAPIASPQVGIKNIGQIADVPVWVFHNTLDPIANIDSPRRTVKALLAEGGTVSLTETNGIDHDAWTPAFREHLLLPWLMKQERGSDVAPLPGLPIAVQAKRWIERNWNSPKYVVPLGAIILMLWVGWCISTRSQATKGENV